MFKIDPWEFWGVEKAVLRNEKVDFGEEQVLRLKDSRVSTPQSIGGTFWMLVRDREWEEDKEWKRIREQRVWRRGRWMRGMLLIGRKSGRRRGDWLGVVIRLRTEGGGLWDLLGWGKNLVDGFKLSV